MVTHLLFLLATQATPTPPYWAALKPGPHPVGFSQQWIMDSTRRLPQGERYGLRLRPVLLNLWYPASRPGGRPMPYGDYFDGAIRAADRVGGLARYAEALVGFERRVAWEELARAEPDSTPPDLRARLERFLNGPTFAFRDAAPAPAVGVVVYTQGSRSSMDDNVVLCEYLASRGYLVVGSAYPEEGGADFATSARDESRPRDIRWLLLTLQRLGIAVPSVTVIGHSAGAQAMLRFATDPSAPVDAIVSLDTTQDYAMLSDRTWSYYTDRVIEERAGIRVPMVVAAGPEALFELADSLSASPRWLVTVPDLDHNDFISQGQIRRQLLDDQAAEARQSRAAAARSYRGLVEFLGDWLDAQRATDRGGSLRGAAPLRVSVVPSGIRFPEVGSRTPSDARELRHLFGTLAPDQFAELALQLRKRDSVAAGNQVLMMLLVDAVRRGDAAHGVAAYQALLAREPAVAGIRTAIERRAALFERLRATREAEEWRALARVFGGG